MDPYSTLGVSKNATQDEIKNAYRSLAKKYHPDLNPGKKDLEAKFKEINTAYEQVGTKEEREKYERGESDAQAQAHARQNERPNYYQSQRDGGRYAQGFGGGGEGGFSQEDIFENLFRNSRHANQAGADELYRMDVDFKESVLGAERTITLPNGKKLQIKIPAGIESGAKLRMKGQGGVGVGSAPAGDAIVEVQVKPLEGFTRHGADIERELAISFIEGLLGAEIKVPTLDGAVMLKVPAGVSSGSRLRIRGKGVALPKGTGDQIVVLKVVLPKTVSPELSAAAKEWNEKFSYNPRGEA